MAAATYCTLTTPRDADIGRSANRTLRGQDTRTGTSHNTHGTVTASLTSDTRYATTVQPDVTDAPETHTHRHTHAHAWKVICSITLRTVIIQLVQHGILTDRCTVRETPHQLERAPIITPIGSMELHTPRILQPRCSERGSCRGSACLRSDSRTQQGRSWPARGREIVNPSVGRGREQGCARAARTRVRSMRGREG